MPYTAHTWLQAPLKRQQHIRLQLYIRNDKMLWYASRMNDINTCINSLIGHCLTQILVLLID